MKDIHIHALEDQLASGENLEIIDVREPYELEQGHIPGVINIPLGDLPASLSELKKDTRYYFICLTGARSQTAVSWLDNQGYDVVNVSGGMMAYTGQVI